MTRPLDAVPADAAPRRVFAALASVNPFTPDVLRYGAWRDDDGRRAVAELAAGTGARFEYPLGGFTVYSWRDNGEGDGPGWRHDGRSRAFTVYDLMPYGYPVDGDGEPITAPWGTAEWYAWRNVYLLAAVDAWRVRRDVCRECGDVDGRGHYRTCPDVSYGVLAAVGALMGAPVVPAHDVGGA